MAEAAARSGRLSMTGYNRRFCPAVKLAREKIEERGPITLITGEYHKAQLHRPPSWGASSWVIADIVHAIDTVRWLGGPVRAVSAVSAVSALARADFHDTWVDRVAAVIDFAGGPIATVASSYGSGARVELFRIHGRGIAAHLEGRAGQVWPPTARIVYACGFWHEHRYFVDCVWSGTLPEPNLGYSVELMELLTAIEAGGSWGAAAGAV